MNFPSNSKSLNFLTTILFLQFTFCIAIFFDIPVARQTIGFIYLSFVPGYIILLLLKMTEFDTVETVVFSIGFSIAFLMLMGLIVNAFCPLLGVSQPLSLIPLTIAINTFILIGAFTVYLKNESTHFPILESVKPPQLTILFSIPPVLSVIGAMWVNVYGNNLILLFMIIAISLLSIGVISKKKLPSKFYPLAILTIAISLLYHSSLISNYIVPLGSDVSVEYFVFKNTQNNAYWYSGNPYIGHIGYGRIHSMLSITILPTLYSNLLNIDSTWVFKILFPLIFSFVPLGLYQICKGYVGEKYAFVSAFLFMAYETFYSEMLRLNRQMIAELFFILLLLVILNNKIKQPKKITCFMILSFGLVTSHYGLSEIFIFFISLTLILSFVIKRPSRNIIVSIVMLFFITMFVWYIYISESAAFDSLLNYASYVQGQLDEFLNPTSRGQTVLRGLGLEAPPTIWNAFSRAFAYATQFLIVAGFIGSITKRKKIRFNEDYFVLISIAMAFLATLIIVPGMAQTMNMTRFYHTLLFFLAPLFVLGASFITELIFKHRKEFECSILALAVLLPYFLFQTGFVYEITKNQSWSLPLSKNRMDPIFLKTEMRYFDEPEVIGARWISKYVNINNFKTYADAPSTSALLNGYGMMIFGVNMGRLSNVTTIPPNAYIYLNKANVVNNIVITDEYLFNTSELDMFENSNKIYSNSECEIYQNK